MLGNIYIDVVAISQGLLLLVFSVLGVVLSEYMAYRILCPKQDFFRAGLTVIYANAVSVLVGVPTIESLDDVLRRVSFHISDGFYERYNEVILFFLCFILTWLVEAGAIYLFRKKLKVIKVFRTAGIVNVVSYIVLGIMVIISNSVISS